MFKYTIRLIDVGQEVVNVKTPVMPRVGDLINLSEESLKIQGQEYLDAKVVNVIHLLIDQGHYQETIFVVEVVEDAPEPTKEAEPGYKTKPGTAARLQEMTLSPDERKKLQARLDESEETTSWIDKDGVHRSFLNPGKGGNQ